MLDFKTTVQANFTSVISTATAYVGQENITWGSQVYSDISPVYTTHLLQKYANDILQSGVGNTTAIGNFALTLLGLPGVKEALVKSIQAPLGIDEATLTTYIQGTLTCLNVAATVLPMAYSYFSSDKKAQESVTEIEKAVKLVEMAATKPKEETKPKEKAKTLDTKKQQDHRVGLLRQYKAVPHGQEAPHKHKSKRKKHKSKNKQGPTK